MPPVSTDDPYIPEPLGCFGDALEQFIRQTLGYSRITIAYSGGLDSTVLLHLLSLAPQLKGRLSAHYIDHGLQKQSSAWAEHCKEVSLFFGVPFQSSKLQWTAVNRQGVEAVARKLRYQILTEDCHIETDALVTGHHQRDQAETLLLNLVRGSGVSGLAAMPSLKKIKTPKGEAIHIRPLLHIPYLAFNDYARHFNLSWVEDPSNQETHYRRNAVRQEVLPVLTSYWPEVEKTLARTADNMSEARTLLDRMARKTLEAFTFLAHYFDFEKLSELDWLEQKNCLRYWFFHGFQIVLSTKHYDWIKGVLDQNSVSQNSAFTYQMKQGALYFYQYRLYYLKHSLHEYCFHGLFQEEVSSQDQDRESKQDDRSWLVTVKEQQVCLHRASLSESHAYYAWKMASHFVEHLPEFVLRTLSSEDDVNRKRLKAFFQKNKIPVWERKVWPVLEYDDQVVSVLGCASCVKESTERVYENNIGGGKKFPPTFSLFISQSECHKLMGYPCSGHA
jgi:tRNA(Ile)-lysidine synthase